MRARSYLNRKLRIFAFDPNLGKRLRAAGVKEITISIPWEMERVEPQQKFVGPVGEYLEVVDYDPASGLFYEPIDLNKAELLASDGLKPNESDPKFHQQMVYAVAMATIAQFEEALGRVALWSSRKLKRDGDLDDEYVQRLRVYPHALREANAYYSPEKKALLFGYFAAGDGDPEVVPGSTIFTCLSHDIVAHETTHALLDGMHTRFVESTNPDVLALHEAFADVVAIFQHFSHSEVLEDQIARTRGDLETENLLGQLAQEFGRALGRGGALRDFLGQPGTDGVWRRRKPDRSLIGRTGKAHQRGAILVAAIFDAFIGIYQSRTADLFRIATNGSGVLPPGAIHPDLVNRLADEAAKSAQHLLRMCIRALDYCPPVDVTFGDYLRAIVTADHDLFPDDEYDYRTAVIGSFIAWGIVPDDLTVISEQTLLWPSLEERIADTNAVANAGESLRDEIGTLIENPAAILEWIKANSKAPGAIDSTARAFAVEISNIMNADAARRTPIDVANPSRERKYLADTLLSQNLLTLGLEANREIEWWAQKIYRELFWGLLTASKTRGLLPAIGLTMNGGAPGTVSRSRLIRLPAMEVHSVRMATRRGNRDQIEREYVVEVTQRRRGYFDITRQEAEDLKAWVDTKQAQGDFVFRRGCTLLIDARTFRVRRVIKTRGDISSNRELDTVRAYLDGRVSVPDNALDGGRFGDPLRDEDFAHLHRSVG